MTEQRDRPTWMVQAVFDPDGNGADFAYSIGLAERAGAEIQLWSRPTDGDDPGEDWKLSMRDAGYLVNDFAYRLLEGNLPIGEPFEMEFDNGAVRATFTPTAPVPAEDLEAHGAGKGTPTIGVRWSLHREPEGTLSPVADDALPDLISWCDRVTSITPTAVAVPEQWRPIPGPLTAADFDPAGEYGPATPLVRAFAASMAAAPDEEIISACDFSMMTEPLGGTRIVLGQALTLARPHGRSAIAKHTMNAAGDLADAIAGPSATPTDVWRSVVRTLGDVEPEEDRQFDNALRQCLRQMIGATLTTAALHDLADDELRLAAYGPWMWAVAQPTAPDGWAAPAHATARVAQLAAALDESGLTHLAELHATAADDDNAAHALHYLAGYSVSAQSGLGDPGQLLPDSATYDALDEDDQWFAGAALTCLVAAASHPDLPEHIGEQLRATYAPALPDIDAFLAQLPHPVQEASA